MFKKLTENIGSPAVKAVVDAVIEAMHERPNDFAIGEHFMVDSKTKYSYKISYNVGVNAPYIMSFGFWQGRRFTKTLDGLKAYQLKAKLEEVKT